MRKRRGGQKERVSQDLKAWRAVCGSEWPKSVWLGDSGWKVGWLSSSKGLACHAKELLGKIQQEANGSELHH